MMHDELQPDEQPPPNAVICPRLYANARLAAVGIPLT
jgi:hypothetical protein